MNRRRMVTIVVHRDGQLDSTTYRVRVGVLRFLKVSGIVLAILLVVGAGSYAPVVRTAARVPRMNAQIARLSAENDQVRQLAQTLNELESRYDQVRAALGANVIPPSSGLEALDPYEAHPVHAGFPGRTPTPSGASRPTGWPLDSVYHPGVLTRGQIPAGSEQDPHPGIDVAVRTGTPIRASGGGVVAEAGYDAEYGLFVLLNHPGNYQTLYGHASRLVVSAGDSVVRGQVIALVGSTGRSTAPHLHFEKRHGDELIDPLAELNRES